MANVWKVTFDITLGGAIGHHAQVGLHYQSDVAIGMTEPSASVVLDKVLSHFSSSGHNLSKLVACLDTATAITDARAFQIVAPGDTDVPGQASEVLGLGGSVSIGSDRMPAGTATWLKMGTGVPGRSFRGGTHWPGSFNPSDLTSSGLWEPGSTFRIALAALCAAIVDVINGIDTGGSDLNPVVYSHVRAQRGLDAATLITSCGPDTTPRFVRRRMRA